MPERNVRSLRAERRIHINGDITAATATNFEKQLAALAKENNEPILVFLESPGGDTFACLKIYQLIMDLREKGFLVNTAGIGAVESGAFFILQAGARRFTAKTATFLFHRAWRSYTDERMNATDLWKELNNLAVIDAQQLLIFTKRGHPIRKILELFSRDARVNAKEARKLNLVDTIITDDNEPPKAPRHTTQ